MSEPNCSTYPWTKPMRLPRVGLLLLAKRAAAAAALSGMPAADGLRDAGNVAYGDPVEGAIEKKNDTDIRQ